MTRREQPHMPEGWSFEGYAEDLGNIYTTRDGFSPIGLTVIERVDPPEYPGQPKYSYELTISVAFFEGAMKVRSLKSALREAERLLGFRRMHGLRSLPGKVVNLSADIKYIRSLQGK